MNSDNDNKLIASKRLNADEVSKILQLWEEQQSIRNNPSLADVAETLGISIEEAQELHQQATTKIVPESKTKEVEKSSDDVGNAVILIILFYFAAHLIPILLFAMLALVIILWKTTGLFGVVTVGAIGAISALIYRKYNRRKRGSVLTIRGRK